MRAHRPPSCWTSHHELNTADIELGSNVDVLVIGMGPTGLGAAKRLNQIVSFLCLDRQNGCDP